tara:strand:+ start:2685 stop:3551 length:867 start_codon:yes stop_codon:yes gene_type:complete
MSNTHSTADAFHRDGFCVIESLIPPSDLKQMQDETQCIIAKASQAAQSNDHFDFEPSHSLDNPRLRRIKRPNEISALFAEMVAHPVILDVVRSIIGDNIRLNHSKINIKGPAFGSALEWHQDWAFIPHTHHGLVIAAIALDDCTPENGPILMMPGSHVGPLYSHHRGEKFVGAIDIKAEKIPVSDDAVAVLGKAGTVSFHHPLTIHGSAINKSSKPRSILFYEYAAADAWPLFYGVDYEEFDSRIVAGVACHQPRLDPVHVRMPYPVATAGAIYAIQDTLEERYFTNN